MSVELLIILACGFLALLYGGLTVHWVLSKSPGNARMQEIAAAIQEGARAYLNRQYRTIAIVGVVIYAALTASTTQKITRGDFAYITGSVEKAAVWGALLLYIEFVGIFLFMLRLFGGGRR